MLVSSTSIHARLAQLAFATLCVSGILWFLLPASINVPGGLQLPGAALSPFSKPSITVKQREFHPIDSLILGAESNHRQLLSKQTKNVHDAANAYRERRGRQPPPGFDAWFKFARGNSALIIEDFFDRIYDDLNPFWGVPAKQIREQANSFPHRISVRDGNVTWRTDIDERPWLNLWTDMLQSVAEHLPDVDLAINVMDESRIVVPWEEIDGYMTRERENRRIVPEEELKTTFENLKDLDKSPAEPFDAQFASEGAYWDMAVVGCHPESPARKAEIDSDFTKPPPPMGDQPAGSNQGYVQNWTLATSPCENPKLQGLHGTFVAPISIANTKRFFPLFGGSKLPMNNEILLPPAMYWTEDPFYSGGKSHGRSWRHKKNQLVWRGAASGGRNTADNWTRFQRHRFVSMVNATNIRQLEESPLQRLANFDLPNNGTYELAAQMYGAGDTAFSDWVNSWADAAVVHLLCFPNSETAPHCPYTDPYFSVAKTMPMQEQYNYKYLPDIDGNSFSGRYRGFLGSTSLPIKATIYQEWHDSRLMPWAHFVPMDNTFVDIFGLMEYFLGNKFVQMEGRDDVARIIAEDGKEWAEKVLRKEDMSVYVLRLLLEYARLCDDDRERMGWAERVTT